MLAIFVPIGKMIVEKYDIIIIVFTDIVKGNYMNSGLFKYFGIGGALVLLGLWSIKKARAKACRCSAVTTARIIRVDVDRERSDNGKRNRLSYIPVIEYIAGEKKYTKSADVYSSDKNKYNVGDQIEVKYNPENPDEFMTSKMSNYGIGTCLLVLGTLAIILGILAACGKIGISK